MVQFELSLSSMNGDETQSDEGEGGLGGGGGCDSGTSTQLSFLDEEEPGDERHRQTTYESSTSLLLRGRDGDTMMSSESSESPAVDPPDSAWSRTSVWSAGDKGLE